jgi:putative transposase
MKSSYPSNLTLEQWELLQSLIPVAKPGGRPRSVDMQSVINAILYLLCAGCAWRMLPSDFPNWKTVYHYFRVWRIDGTWERINHKLYQWVRVSENREVSPSAAILDSQSVKTATPAAIEVGYDSAKQTKGRKRHLLVDTLGLVLMVVVTAASVPERAGAKLVLARLHQVRDWVGRLAVIWVDGGYQGQQMMQWVMDNYRWVFQAVLRTDNVKGFVPIAQRWKVERTFGWLNWCRRLSKDYEILPQTSEAFIYVANIRLMLRRLA